MIATNETFKYTNNILYTTLYMGSKKMKKAIYLLPLAMFAIKTKAQITEQEALPIDSLIANTYLTAVNVHGENINSTPTGSVLTWDAVNGRFENKGIGYSFPHRVDEETAEAINSVDGKEYKLFDLDSFSDVNQYQNAVEDWLREIGLPVNTNNYETLENKIFPNPVRNNAQFQANIPAGKKYEINIFDITGRMVKQHKGITENNGLNLNLDFTEFANGPYIVNFYNENTSFSKKVVKQ